MSLTYQEEISDGVQTLYPLKFTYKDQASVYVYTGAHEEYASTGVPFSWADDNTIEILDVDVYLPEGTEFTIRRIVTRSNLIHEFANKSIRGAAIDAENWHVLELVQEVMDGFLTLSGTTPVPEGFDLLGKTIRNVGKPQADTDGARLADVIERIDQLGVSGRQLRTSLYTALVGSLPTWAVWLPELTSAATVDMRANPEEGEEVLASDISGTAGTFSATLVPAAGHTISSGTLNKNSMSRKWRFNATTGNWDLLWTIAPEDPIVRTGHVTEVGLPAQSVDEAVVTPGMHGRYETDAAYERLVTLAPTLAWEVGDSAMISPTGSGKVRVKLPIGATWDHIGIPAEGLLLNDYQTVKIQYIGNGKMRVVSGLPVQTVDGMYIQEIDLGRVAKGYDVTFETGPGANDIASVFTEDGSTYGNLALDVEVELQLNESAFWFTAQGLQNNGAYGAVAAKRDDSVRVRTGTTYVNHTYNGTADTKTMVDSYYTRLLIKRFING